jgi:hypothetical protein
MYYLAPTELHNVAKIFRGQEAHQSQSKLMFLLGLRRWGATIEGRWVAQL